MSGVGDSMKPDQMYEHPESPMSGDYMTSQVISFEKIKLTNHEKPCTGQVNMSFMLELCIKFFYTVSLGIHMVKITLLQE